MKHHIQNKKEKNARFTRDFAGSSLVLPEPMGTAATGPECVTANATDTTAGTATALRHFGDCKLEQIDVSTMVLVDEAGVHVRSTAALRVIARCGLPYSWLRILLWLLPAPLRDAGYKMVASVRYLVFGKDDGTTCRRMTKAIRQRFHE